MHFDFGEQFGRGENYEAQLDRRFGDVYAIRAVDRDVQRRGIDRIFTHRRTKRSFAVEYKADFYVSGNAFIETVSVDTTNTPGWTLTSKADILVYHFVRWDDPYILPMAVARQIATGPRRHRLVSVPNKDYMTKGLLVPLKELAEQRISEEDFRQGRFQM